MKRVLIAESLDEKVLAEFAGSGVEFVYSPDISAQELETAIIGFDGLIVRPKPVSEKAIANADSLKLIIRGGAGVNSIALEACRRKGIIVENTPGLNSDATAEFTIQLMLQTYTKRAPVGRELKGKKLGIIGMGNIGKRVAKISEGFGMKVMTYSRKDGDLNDILRNCDIISLHIPLSPETENLIGEREFELMKPGVVIINTARPQLINIDAFKKHLNKLGSFAIDGDYELVKPFLDADPACKGIITDHIADATYEAQSNIARAALIQAVEFFVNGKEINRVT